MMIEKRCIHRHTIKTHPNCFRKGLIKQNWWENKRIAYLDIETSDLKANFGIVLTWCLKYHGDKTIYSSKITKKEIFDFDFDKRVVKELLDELKNVDIVVTYNGTNFDIPFIRTRALKWNYDFPKYGSIAHWDLYFRVKSQFRTHRKSLAVITEFLGIDGKTPIKSETWFKGTYGDEKSLKAILDHNKADVVILEELYKRIGEFSKWTRKSI